jgi:hypothetical protein
MFLTRWLFPRRRRAPEQLGRVRPLVEALEERYMLSADPVIMPGSHNATVLSDVFFTGVKDGHDYGPVPVKLMTFTNNTSQTIYPYFRDPNTGQPKGATSFWDPVDPHREEFRGYLGYRSGGVNYLGLPMKTTITVTVPLVFWDSGRVEIAAEGSDIIAQNAAQQQNPFRYDVNAVRYITQPNLESFTNDYSGGLVMWYHSPTALDASNDAPVQLTEYTIRDAYLGTLPNPTILPDGELHSLVNYDVSYVDSMVLPIAMEATSVPIPIPPYDIHSGPIGGPVKDFGWIGAQLTIDQLQNGIKTFTSTTSAGGILGDYFGGNGYPYYNNPNTSGDIKVPSGQNLIFQSPLALVRSTYSTYGPLNQWMLSSGGTEPIGEIVGGTSAGQTNDTTITLNHASDTDKAMLQVLHDLLDKGLVFNVTASTDPVASDIQADTTLSSVDPSTGVATLSKSTIPANRGLHVYTFQRPVTDYAASALVDLWYSWAKYYVDHVNAAPVTDRAGSISADGKVLTIDANGLVVGMSISPQNGIRPGTTILSIAKDKLSVNLSQPGTPGSSGNYSFAVPTFSSIPGNQQANIFPLTADGAGNSLEKLLAFSQDVYEVMSVMGTIPKMTDLPAAFELLGNAIGCNVGFLPVQNDTINGEIRDLVKSILRGVNDYRLFSEDQWYPDPKEHVGGRPFNIYNLDPFVFFVHRVLKLSGYGFSVDDDVADVQSNYGNNLSFSISGLGTGGVNPLKNTDEWSNGAPFGTVSDQAAISIDGDKYSIKLADKKIYWQVYPPSDLGPGALVSGEGIQPGTRIKAYGPLDDLVFILDTKPLKTGTFPLTFSGQPLTQGVRKPTVAADFDHDGNKDILWRQESTGDVWIWRMSGTQLQATNPFVHLGASPAGDDWQITGTGDFDRDGNQDILWRQTFTGQVWIWRMNGTQLQPARPYVQLGTSPPGAEWQITGTGDFDKDGNQDILWRQNSTGQVWIWRMNGTQLKATNPYVQLGTSPLGNDWQISGTGDFDKDGNQDILWRQNSTGQVWIWRLNGTQLQLANPYVQIGTSPPGDDWRMGATGDFDKDGNIDILWRQLSTGAVWLWRMNGIHLRDLIFVANSPAGTEWQVG